MQKKQQQISRKKAWLEKPFRLTVGEAKAPMAVLKDFFGYYDLLSVHDHISLLVNNIPDNAPAFMDTTEFVHDIEKLVEANFFLLRKNAKKAKKTE